MFVTLKRFTWTRRVKRVESEYILPSHIFMKLTVGWQALRPINPFQFYYYKCDVKSQLCFVTLHLNQTDSSVRVILGWNKKQNRSNFMLMLSKACLHEPISHEHLVVPPKQREFWRKDACRPPAGTCKLAPALRGPEQLQIVCLPNAFLSQYFRLESSHDPMCSPSERSCPQKHRGHKLCPALHHRSRVSLAPEPRRLLRRWWTKWGPHSKICRLTYSMHFNCISYHLDYTVLT